MQIKVDKSLLAINSELSLPYWDFTVIQNVANTRNTHHNSPVFSSLSFSGRRRSWRRLVDLWHLRPKLVWPCEHRPRKQLSSGGDLQWRVGKKQNIFFFYRWATWNHIHLTRNFLLSSQQTYDPDWKAYPDAFHTVHGFLGDMTMMTTSEYLTRSSSYCGFRSVQGFSSCSKVKPEIKEAKMQIYSTNTRENSALYLIKSFW
jgi:hypothetical protein